MESEFIKQMYDSHSSEEVYDEDDCFLVGDGNKSLLRARKTSNNSNQLTGIRSVKDLKAANGKCVEESTTEDDLSEFSGESFECEFEEYYYEIKRKVFDRFGYVEIKSQQFSGRPIRERDLVLSEDDRYLVNYLISQGVIDNYLFDSLAQLSALLEMGFSKVRFNQRDGCALCLAHDGLSYDIKTLISLLGSGKYLVHEFCECYYIPIIEDRKAVKVKVDEPEVCVADTVIKNLPIEFLDEIYLLLSGMQEVGLSYSEISFSDFMDVEKWDHEVVKQVGDTLCVHSMYLGDKSPIDYLRAWVIAESKTLEDYSDVDISELDVYYLNGKKVVEIDGFYIDVETKKVVEGI